jgi:hypothetical protein
MNHDEDPHPRISRIKTYIIWGAVAWTVIMAASLLWNILNPHRNDDPKVAAL